jgi:hypothetical protein
MATATQPQDLATHPPLTAAEPAPSNRGRIVLVIVAIVAVIAIAWQP